MKFLIDEDLPRSIGEIFKKHGYEAYDIRDVGLRGSKDSQVASYAKSKHLCIVTGDYDFSNIRNYPPQEYYGIIVIYLPRNITLSYIISMVDSFLQRKEIISKLSGKTVIVEKGRVRIRSQ